MSVRGFVARHDLALFFGLAYLLSWAIWPLILLNPTSTPLVPFGPLIAALAVTALAGGWQALAALMGQLGRWRVHPLWYLTAVVGPFVLTGLAGATAVAAGAPSPGLGVYADWSGLVTTLVATMIIVGLFEELGWRGFALPRMQRNHSALWAALVLGIVWALWHLPELVSDPGEREPLPFLLTVVAYSVLLAWLYNSTRGSLLIVIIFHAAINTSAKFLMPEFEGRDTVTAWWSYAGVYVLAALAVIALAGAERLTTDLRRRGGARSGAEASANGKSKRVPEKSPFSQVSVPGPYLPTTPPGHSRNVHRSTPRAVT